jgi:peptidoglycan/LPS O-acetylase OafA/YrhL
MFRLFQIEIDDKRVYGLDILRCLAILFVILSHGNSLLPESVTKFIKLIVFDGVSLFFVLSGFLIGGILIKVLEKEEISSKTVLKFWTRRWFRTLPNYFLVLILLFLLHLFFRDGINFPTLGKYFIFSQNLYYKHPSFFPEAWSLSIEEWFYLIVPVFILIFGIMLKYKVKRSLLLTALIILVATTLFRFYRSVNIPLNNIDDWDEIFRKQVFMRLDSLMYGVIGAYIAFFHRTLWLKHKFALLISGIVILTCAQIVRRFNIEGFGLYLCVFSFSINSFATLLLLPFLSDLKSGKGAVYRYVTVISLISYSMYLLNLSVILDWILRYVNLNMLHAFGIILKYLLFWFLTIGLSIILYKYYEVPMTRLRDRI